VRWRVGSFLQVIEYLPDHYRILNAGDDLHSATALLADLHVNVEHPLEALGPGHGRALFGGRSRFDRYLGLITFAPLRGGDQGAVSAVEGEHAAVVAHDPLSHENDQRY
jgi:hypothetical protein